MDESRTNSPKERPKDDEEGPVYLPSNEPYLGRESVLAFDQTIVFVLETNAKVAALTHRLELSDLQAAACQIVPQGINLALTIRELVRQAYLFGALVLMRPLVERAAVISYLYANPAEVSKWHDGWHRSLRPNLATMMATMSGQADAKSAAKTAQDICTHFNHIVHGDPIGSYSNLCQLPDGSLGYSCGRDTRNPSLCDEICFQSYCYLMVLGGMALACFPEIKAPMTGPRFGGIAGRDDHN